MQQGRQQRHDHMARQAGGHVQPHLALQRCVAGLLELALELVHVGQQVLAAFVAGLAVLGELHAPRGPVQQPRAQPRLQLLHGLGDAGLGQTHAVGRTREAGHLGHAAEDLHLLQKLDCLHDANK